MFWLNFVNVGEPSKDDCMYIGPCICMYVSMYVVHVCMYLDFIKHIYRSLSKEQCTRHGCPRDMHSHVLK